MFDLPQYFDLFLKEDLKTSGLSIRGEVTPQVAPLLQKNVFNVLDRYKTLLKFKIRNGEDECTQIIEAFDYDRASLVQLGDILLIQAEDNRAPYQAHCTIGLMNPSFVQNPVC